ncbi:DNA starvation/stationary phase protection protein [soil metagenome]
MADRYTIPGMDPGAARQVAETLQERLNAMIDLQLTLKHIHWNVVGPAFIGVHEMLDPQVDAVRLMSDDIAERIATLGFEPAGTPGYVAKHRSWEDYSIGRAPTQEHLAALDVVFRGIVTDHRQAIDKFEDLDLVSQDMLIEQSEKLEMYQWFVRAHLEDRGGHMAHDQATTERGAADAVAEQG